MAASIGDLARSTGIEIRTLPMAGATSILTGKVVMANSAGEALNGTTAGTVEKGLYIAVETVDNSAGAAGDKTIRVASGNTYVYCEAGGAINFGHTVKSDASADLTAATGVFGAEVLVGRYIGHENEDVNPTDAVDGDVIIVRLGL
jgi:hypothetical protein